MRFEQSVRETNQKHRIVQIYWIKFLFKWLRYVWPITTAMLSTIVMLCTSATAHLLHQKSEHSHMKCFLCDFSGISFNVFGCVLMQNYMCSPVWYYRLLWPYLLPVTGLLSALCCLFNCLAQTIYHRPYPAMKRVLQFAPCALSWLFTNFPVLLQFAYRNESENELSLDYTNHLISYVVFLLGVFCFATDFPQRFFPGRFDFFGQGHHWFHLAVLFGTILGLQATYNDYRTNRDLIASSRPPPTFAFCFLSLLTISAYYIFVIKKFTQMINKNFDKEGNIIEKTSKVD